MNSEVLAQVDTEGIIILVPMGAPGCYSTITLPKNLCDSITEKWYAQSKDEIIHVQKGRHARRKTTGTIMR